MFEDYITLTAAVHTALFVHYTWTKFIQFVQCKISGSCGSTVEDSGLLECDVLLGEFVTFWRILMPSSSRVKQSKKALKGEGGTILQTIRDHLFSDTASHPEHWNLPVPKLWRFRWPRPHITYWSVRLALVLLHREKGMFINTFTASYLNTQGLNNSCLKSPASTLVDLTFQSRALRSSA